MINLVSAIVALCKALPVLEKVFLIVAARIREAKAKSNYEDKLSEIDSAIDSAFVDRVQDETTPEWSLDPDRSPPVSKSSTDHT